MDALCNVSLVLNIEYGGIATVFANLDREVAIKLRE